MQPKALIFSLNLVRIQKKEHLPERISSRNINSAIAAATSFEITNRQIDQTALFLARNAKHLDLPQTSAFMGELSPVTKMVAASYLVP